MVLARNAGGMTGRHRRGVANVPQMRYRQSGGFAGGDMRGVFFMAALACGCLSGGAAMAWGNLGHRIICQIALEELKPEIRARVDALVAIDPRYPCSPTLARGRSVSVNLPRDATGIKAANPCPAPYRCVVSAILSDMRDLALSTDVSDQLRLLKLLGHWVGDIHQPLHVAFEDDKGGNAVAVTGLCERNLHAVWDRCLIERSIGLDYMDAATQLRSEIAAEDRARWAAAEKRAGFSAAFVPLAFRGRKSRILRNGKAK
jgi:hypothetical protein